VSVIVVDKPAGRTSFDVVRRIRGALARRLGVTARSLKVGHTGTLDPLASGVLPICIGEATKLAPFLLGADKCYETEVRFGVETDTLDADGDVVATHPVPTLTPETLEAALVALRGPIAQVPPMFSALKRDGRPLYAYARAGTVVEREARPVVIHELELLGLGPPDGARLRVRCSKGTYIRVLVADLGQALGCGAHVAALRRTVSGPFSAAQALPLAEVLDRIATGQALPLVALAEAVAHLPSVMVDAARAEDLRRGRAVAWDALGAAAAPAVGACRVLGAEGGLVAVAEPGPEGRTKVLRVFKDDATTTKVMLAG
jgi:tRNA pseudouridine55 synthase